MFWDATAWDRHETPVSTHVGLSAEGLASWLAAMVKRGDVVLIEIRRAGKAPEDAVRRTLSRALPY